MLLAYVHCLKDRSNSQIYYRLKWDIQKDLIQTYSIPEVQDFMQNAIVPDNISLDINGILNHKYGIYIQTVKEFNFITNINLQDNWSIEKTWYSMSEY